MTIDTIGDVTVSIAIFLKTSINLLDNISTDLLVVRSDFNRPPYWWNMGFSYRVPQSSYTADNFTLPKATFKKKIRMILLKVLGIEDSYKDLEFIISTVNFYSS